MRRVVLDTNIIVSALISPNGIPAQIFNAVLQDLLLICHDSRITAEYEKVLSRAKFDFDIAMIRYTLDTIVMKGLSVIPETSVIPMPDESDRKFYEVAASCSAILITGNLKHYPDAPFIMTAADFFHQHHNQ
jgi:putative PIN family toxin of toxin-antitoxin system